MLAFCDYCLGRRARINNLNATDLFILHGSNAYSSLIGEEGDISTLCQYNWHNWCYFRDKKKELFSFNREFFDHMFGPAVGEGNEIHRWVLKVNGSVVPCWTLCSLYIDEIHSPIECKNCDTFDSLVERRWSTSISPPDAIMLAKIEVWEAYHGIDEFPG